MGINAVECKKYADTLGSQYGIVKDMNAPAGCFGSDPGDGTVEMRFNRAKSTQPCGVSYGFGRAQCLHELPFSLVKTYNKEFDIIRQGPADLSATKEDCKRYADINALQMKIQDTAFAPPGCYRERRTQKRPTTIDPATGDSTPIPAGCPTTGLCNNQGLGGNKLYVDQIYWNDTMTQGVDCGLVGKMYSKNPFFKDNNVNNNTAAIRKIRRTKKENGFWLEKVK